MASRRAPKRKPVAGGESRARTATTAPFESALRRARRAAFAGDSDAAIPLYIEAISAGCALPSAFNDLGALLAQRGQIAAAIIQFEIALTVDPSARDVRENLSHALELSAAEAFQAGRWHDSATAYDRQVALDDTAATARANAGVAWLKAGAPERALPHFRHVVGLSPDSATAHFQLGLALFLSNERDCEAAFRRATELDPGHVDAHVNLAIVYNRLGRLARAKELLGEALRLDANHAEAHSNFAAIARDQGDLDSSLAHYRRALDLKPNAPTIFSDYLLTRQADPRADATALLAEHVTWNDRFATPVNPGDQVGFGPPSPSHVASDPGRRLRIGYVSADLRKHSVANFIEPLIAAHDRERFHVTCYSSGVADAVTGRIRSEARPDAWRDARGWSDEALAARIVADRIDVLVDLAGHTADHRLLTFARRPAPVQVSYCGYPGSTGLAAMAWRLTDAVADPPGVADVTHSEKLWRLPRGFLCFRADPDFPAVAPGPMAVQGFVTFGSFNNLAKIGDEVLRTWAEILRATPDSRLLFKARGLSDEEPRTRLRGRFARLGIEDGRILFASYAASSVEHVRQYECVDIALDPFPYAGTTTTCEALWMGVPVITWAGTRHAGRVGASILTAIGHGELVAADLDRYVHQAVALAHDRARLASYRDTLRADMAASPLLNQRMIAADIEAAYVQMWRQAVSHPDTGADSR